MEDFTNTIDDSNFIFLGLDYWDGSDVQVNKFRSDGNVTFSILTKGSTLGTELGLTDRTHFIVIGPQLKIRYTTKDNDDQYKGFDSDPIEPVIEQALSEIGMVPVVLPEQRAGLIKTPDAFFDVMGRRSCCGTSEKETVNSRRSLVKFLHTR